MIYCPGRFIFIHIPRTAGISITRGLASTDVCDLALINTCNTPAEFWRHVTATEVKPLIPDWGEIKKFAFYRSDHDIYESDYRLHKSCIKDIDSWPDVSMLSDWKKSVLQSNDESFQQFIQRHWVPWLGQDRTVWEHWTTHEFERFKFDDLINEWNRLLEWLEITYVPLQHLNRTK